MATPIKAWWWQGKPPNYGDELNPHIISYISGRPVSHVEVKEAELFAIGSIMRSVRQCALNRDDPPHVWGSGMRNAMRSDFTEKTNFSLVRGPLSATTVMLDDLPHGDPGLLTAEALGIDGAGPKTHRFGVVPHWTHTEKSEVQQLLEALPHARLIDMRSDDVHATTQAMADCDVILSSSLHGLIVADGLGIPNAWMDSGRIGQTSPFKFFDYALSVGRPMPRPVKFADLIADKGCQPDTHYFSRVPAVIQTIKDSFPEVLKA